LSKRPPKSNEAHHHRSGPLHGIIHVPGSLAFYQTPGFANAFRCSRQIHVPFKRVLNLMEPTLSLAIPAHNEEKYIGRCIESIVASARLAEQSVEIVVALNRCTDRTQQIAESLGARCVSEDSKCIAAVRNAAVRATTSPAVATLDADSWMSANTVAAIMKNVYDPCYIGGGTRISLERFSVGILFSVLATLPYQIKHGAPGGMFWFLRESFDSIGGFDESLVSVEDLDFAVRLKAFGKRHNKRYGIIQRDGITTSSRKFDKFGDWYLFKNPRLVRSIFKGKDRPAADHFYYDVER
jgi:glycosyltransferase involved in cell wall biosynthesis